MSLQNIEDRVPTLPGRYLITHEDNSTEYVTVTRADEPTIAGTSFNRALFSNLQGDIYTGVQYNTPAYVGTAMTLDLPLTSYETGKIINIISPATFNSYPTLNINGLGAKTVNSVLAQNKRYTLIYNGDSFDSLAEPQIITATGNYDLSYSRYYCVAIGGGGGVGKGTGTGGRTALGGDGGLVAGIFTPRASTTAVVVGAGGATANNQAGAGGDTSIGDFVAYGGAGGKGGSGSTGSSSNAPTPGVGGKGKGGAILEGITPVQEGSSSTWILPEGHTIEGVNYGKGGDDTSGVPGTAGAVILYPLF